MKTRKKTKRMRYEKYRTNGEGYDSVYSFIFQMASEISEEVSEISKNFPKEKIYLADIVRRQSELVCINLKEAWRMKEHKTVFLDKLSDAAQAASKTQNGLEFASRYNYIDKNIFKKLDAQYEEIFEMLCDGTNI
jgi:four helix bundle protein